MFLIPFRAFYSFFAFQGKKQDQKGCGKEQSTSSGSTRLIYEAKQTNGTNRDFYFQLFLPLHQQQYSQQQSSHKIYVKRFNVHLCIQESFFYSEYLIYYFVDVYVHYTHFGYVCLYDVLWLWCIFKMYIIRMV